MNLSILHISDLHRDSNNPIRNDVLLDSLENDCRHFSAEEDPKVRSPDLIVVSGDIIEGIKSDAPQPEDCLREQYERALDFLRRLSDHFVGGNRNRVVIVPGNHDVSSYHLDKSLESVDILPDRKRELVKELFSSGTSLRWSWRDLQLKRIADPTMYLQRMAAFSQFYSDFYEGQFIYDLDPAKQVDIFDYPEFDLTIVGFSSCYNNDLYNRHGAIHPACIAEVGNRLRDPLFSNRLRVAVWHHNTEGPPARSDYMDPDTIQNLIDRGFSIGLHGHQHRPQYLDTRFRHGVERKITVISAGTLCGGPDFRHGRAYNIIELSIPDRTGCLHVREMQNDNLNLPIWGRRALPPNTRSHYDFQYDPPPPPSSTMNESTAALIEAQDLHINGEYQKAAHRLTAVLDQETLARPLLLDCLIQIGDTESLLDVFDPPSNEAEAIHLMDALWTNGKRERLGQVLDTPFIAQSNDPSVVTIRNKYTARLR